MNDFEREAEKAKDPDLKACAAQTLPTLHSHLDAAKQLKRK